MNFGSYIRDTRLTAGLSLRLVAKTLGVSHVFLWQVEHGQTALARVHWPTIMALLPALDEHEMSFLECVRIPVRMTLSDKPPHLQRLGVAFARFIEAGSMDRATADRLAEILNVAP